MDRIFDFGNIERQENTMYRTLQIDGSVRMEVLGASQQKTIPNTFHKMKYTI